MNKWNQDYLVDTAERVGTTGLYGLITMLTADATGAVSGSARQWWLVVGLPMALSLAKCLLMNLQTSTVPSASVVKVTSLRVHPAGLNKEPPLP